jgi:hypothetical protein
VRDHCRAWSARRARPRVGRDRLLHGEHLDVPGSEPRAYLEPEQPDQPARGIPAGATVTSIDAFINWDGNPPSGTVYRTQICDYNTLVCLNSGSTSGNHWSIAGWPGWAGKPAATWSFKIAAEIDDGSTSTIHKVYSPTRYTNSRWVTVYYSY